MNINEKIRLLSGRGSWHTYNCNGELPEIMMSDGPHGLRKQDVELFGDVNRSEQATCFPTASAVASSWNTEIASKMGDAISKEALAEKVSIVLGCGVNIKRSPLCGRNFEYFSEDPFLAGHIAAAWINGLQKNGVGASLKHFAGNNQETRRQTSNSQIDERALREIYLSAFEYAVKNSSPLTIMASYNRMDGKYVCANKRLLTDILRNEWGYKGLIVSDWGAAIDIVECIKAGLDLEMPDSSSYHTKILQNAYEQGLITEQQIDRAANNVINLVNELHPKIKDYKVNYTEQHQIAKEIECDSAVLLKNNGILPLSLTQLEKKRIYLCAAGKKPLRFQGAGSSHISTTNTPTLFDELVKKGFDVVSCDSIELDDDLVERSAKEDVPFIYVTGLTDETEGEGFDRKTINLPVSEAEKVKRITEANKNTILICLGGSPFVIPSTDKAAAILLMYLGGEAVGDAVADILSGVVNPSGKLAETFPLKDSDIPCNEWYAQKSDDIEYRESIFVGYRYYESFNIPVQYEFGYGLSYTTFEYSDVKLSSDVYSNGKLKVSFTIKNTGIMEGKEVSQVYVINPQTNIMRPVKELRGFVKTSLKPGEEECVSVELDERSFSIYDVESKQFVMLSGDYKIAIGASVKDIKLTKEIKVVGIELSRDEKAVFPEYFKTGKLEVSEKQFEKLYGKPLSNLNTIPKGMYTLQNSFERVAEASLYGKLVLSIVLSILYKMNKGKKKDDPSVVIVVQGIKENPLESLITMSGGLVPQRLIESVILSANKKHLQAFLRLFRK